VALVDDDVAEVVLGVVGEQEVGVGVVGGYVEGLVGGDEHAGVLLGVAGRDRRGVGAEDGLQGAGALDAQLVAVADEERALELAGVGDALEQVDGDERLAGAGREREQRPLGRARALALGDLLEHGADGGVLVVAPRALAGRVALQQRSGCRVVEREADALLVAGAQVGGRRELCELARRVREAGEAVELHELVAVAGEDELHVEALGGRVQLGLLQPMSRWLVLGLGLDEGDGYGLRVGRSLDAQRVVGAPPGLLEGPAVDDLDGAGRLLAADEVLGPAARVDGGVDELGARIGFRKPHWLPHIVRPDRFPKTMRPS
jgi:hypothetical protein